MIVTSSPYEMKEDFKNLEYELPETVKITDSPNDVFQFLVTYNARIFDFWFTKVIIKDSRIIINKLLLFK